MVKYFAIVAYDQVSLLMSHEEIGSNQTANRNGDNLDQAILRLGLPAYQLKSSRVLRVVQDILLGPEIVWAILQTALSKGPSNALSVSIMEYVAKATGITVMDLQQGKESVYSIEDKLPDPFILIRDVARSDDQSFGLDALLTIDPSPEGDPYRPYIWPVNLNKFFYQQIVSAIKESKDYQLSGLRGLVAEQYYFNDRRLIWLDAYDGKLNPTGKTCILTSGANREQNLI
jgi:hypothetical protein